MNIIIILWISVLLQFAAAFLALRLIRLTGKRLAWVFIAAAIFLMAIRRCITLFQIHYLGLPCTNSLSAELVALVISLLMLVGMIRIAPLFLSLKLSENELRESREEYRSLFENVPISLWEEDFSLVRLYIDNLRNQGIGDFRNYFSKNPKDIERCVEMVNIIDVNKATMKLFAAEKKIDLTSRLSQIFREETYDVFRDQLITLVEGNTKFESERLTRTLRGDDRYVYLSLSVAPGYEATWARVLLSLSDITKRKKAEEALRKAYNELELRVQERTLNLSETNQQLEQEIAVRQRIEEALRESEEQFRRTVEEAPIPIIMQAEDGQVLQISSSWTRLIGYTREDIKTFDAWLNQAYGDGADAVRKYVHSIFNGNKRSDNIEFSIRTAKGDLRYWSFSASSPCTLNDGRRFIVGMAEDITERKKVEQIKDEFIGMVSHELRTPLTVIYGSLITAIAEGISHHDSRELVQNAIEGAVSLQAILENMLELSRYQADRLNLQIEKVSIPEVTSKVLRELRDLEVKRDFREDFPSDLHAVYVDPTRLGRILYNLLENAVKYSQENSQIVVSARNEGDFVVTSISDEGRGISLDDQKRLFEPFSRLDDKSSSPGGVGLGLVVCKRLVEAQHGRIWIESRLGVGSTFYFSLPINRT